MKFIAALSLAALVSAIPQGKGAPQGKGGPPGKGAKGGAKGGSTYNLGSTCADNVLIIARGSTEPGNVGVIIGAPLCAGLKRKYGAKFACQGIGTQDGYPAAMGDNSKPKGTCDSCVTGSVRVFQKVHAQCPKAKLMFMGYSQGGALMSNVIPALPPDVKKSVIGGVMFGSTRGTIAGFPKENVAFFCSVEDKACNRRGNSGSSGSHMSYPKNGDVDKAIAFLSKKIDSAR